MKVWLSGGTSHPALLWITAGALAWMSPIGSAAAAPGLTVTVNGFFEQQVGFATNRESHANVGKRVAVDTQTDNEIHFNIRTQLDNGIGIVGHVEFDAGSSSDLIDEQYIRISGNFGQLVLGSENSAAYQMQLQPRTGGIGVGSIEDWVIRASGASGSGNSAIESVQLNFEDSDADKITYFTPRYAGAQFGVSYVPNAEQDRSASQASVESVYGDGLALGLNYRRAWDRFSIGVAAGYSTWLNTPNGHPSGRPQGLSGGLELGVGNFKFSAGYMVINNLFDGAGDITANAQDGQGYAIGAEYTAGPYRFGALFHHGVADGLTNIAGRDKSDLVHLSVGRPVGPGVRLSVSAVYADWKGEEVGSGDDNDGWAVVTQLRMNF